MNFFSNSIDNLIDRITFNLLVVADADQPVAFDGSIESMSSHAFGIGIFYFLIIAILVFVGISFLVVFKDKGKSSKMKAGEKLLFIWIMFGVVVAIVFGAAQMMHGYLF